MACSAAFFLAACFSSASTRRSAACVRQRGGPSASSHGVATRRRVQVRVYACVRGKGGGEGWGRTLQVRVLHGVAEAHDEGDDVNGGLELALDHVLGVVVAEPVHLHHAPFAAERLDVWRVRHDSCTSKRDIAATNRQGATSARRRTRVRNGRSGGGEIAAVGYAAPWP